MDSTKSRARKYRPGHVYVIRTPRDPPTATPLFTTLVNSIITKNRIGPSLSPFRDPPRVAQTTVARILPKALTSERGPTGTALPAPVPPASKLRRGPRRCPSEIDAASHTSVDDVREIP